MAVDCVRKRQLIYINFRFPDGTYLDHPALVMSDLIDDDIYEMPGGGFSDKIFYAMLISTKNHFEDRTYELKPEFFDVDPKMRKSYFVTHMVGYFTLKDVINVKECYIKNDYFYKLQNMFMKTLGIEFEEE